MASATTADAASAGLRVRVSGRVQGVGFRWSAGREANRLGVTGWVRNAADGSVEAEIHGADDALDGMLAWFARGPEGASVADVAVEACPQSEGPAPDGFTISS